MQPKLSKKMDLSQSETFADFVREVKTEIRAAQYRALQKVNREMIGLYWLLGKLIAERQQKHGWGKSVVENLSKEIQLEFPGLSGFSSANLWRMRVFFDTYKDDAFLAPLVREIGWSHNMIIFQKCKQPLQRAFYIRMTQQYGWTKNVLMLQVENQSYEKYLLNQTNFDQNLPEALRPQAVLAVKDEYTFDFIELTAQHSEWELEQALIKNIRAFLIEMGGDFAFIGNQYRLEVGTKEYFIDLRLFHRRLQSLVAIELKIGEFEPEHKGKMEFYLTALNAHTKMPHENDAIGIIICQNKESTVVEYALKSSNHPIGVATYTITKTLPDSYAGLLPSEAEIQKRLKWLFK